MKKTSIIILSCNTLLYTRLCIESIRRHTKKGSYEILVVDNASLDGSVQWLEQQPDVKCIFNGENKGFPKGCNQGIQMATGSEILLLNSDTIVTPRWLEQMLTALYSSDKVGAVSCVTNVCSNDQEIKVPYKTTEGILLFAEGYNIQDTGKWERRLKLVGFCFLVKRMVVEKIGSLDEAFSPGNFEDDDYSLRILEAGYELLLCGDTFIHHFGSMSFKKAYGDVELEEKQRKYNALLERNANYFEQKWKVPAECANTANFPLFDFIGNVCSEIKILEIACGCGSGLLRLKDLYPQAEILGIEMDAAKARIAGFCGPVRYCPDIEQQLFSLVDISFDIIVLGDFLGCLKKPKEFLKRLAGMLSPKGKVLFRAQNAMNWLYVKHLLGGYGCHHKELLTDCPLTNRFTQKDIFQILDLPEYKIINMLSEVETENEFDENFISNMQQLSFMDNKMEWEPSAWLIAIERNRTLMAKNGELFLPAKYQEVVNALIKINSAGLTREDCEYLWQLYIAVGSDPDEFVVILLKSAVNFSAVLTALTVYAYQHENEQQAMQMLVAGYSIRPLDNAIIYTLACLLDLQQDTMRAQQVLKNYRGTEKHALRLKEELEMKCKI